MSVIISHIRRMPSLRSVPSFELSKPGHMVLIFGLGHERNFGMNKPGRVFSLFEPGLNLICEIGDYLGFIN